MLVLIALAALLYATESLGFSVSPSQSPSTVFPPTSSFGLTLSAAEIAPIAVVGSLFALFFIFILYRLVRVFVDPEYAAKLKAQQLAPTQMALANALAATAAASQVTMPAGIKRALAQKGKRFVVFISHHKRDGGETAVALYERLAGALGVHPGQIFLDTEELADLNKLKQAMAESCCVVLLLTEQVLTRPWCLVELMVAVQHHIPIVPVELDGKRYDYELSKRFLAQSAFGQALELLNPGAVDELQRQGFDPQDMANALSSTIPYLLSTRYFPQGTKEVRDAAVNNIAHRIVRAVEDADYTGLVSNAKVMNSAHV